MEDVIDETVSSEDLMARIAEGDEDAFEILVHRHQTSVLNLFIALSGTGRRPKTWLRKSF